MRSRGACLVLALVVAASTAAPRLARARAPGDDNDLGADDDDAPKTPAKPATSASSAFGTYTPPVQTLGARTYTLAECLALTDRNFPNLWAARARLAFAHAQLDEAKWTPWSQWNLESKLLVVGQLGGTPVYTAQGQAARNLTYLDNAQPWFTADLNGVIPLYTFGKITAVQKAGEAQVRVNEWDLEKTRQLARMDVRRAFYGAMLARDGRYIINDVIDKLEGGIRGLEQKLAKNDGSVEEIDKIRLQVILEETRARAGEADRGERYAMAALRFYTGVQTGFDIPDEPLKRPDVVIAPLVRYLSAARIFRPEVNMARAGIAARQAQLDYARAQFFPDIGIGVGASYSIAPAATPQYGNVWANDPFNHFYAGAALGLRWGLDLLPKSARAAQAESQLEEVRAQERMALGGIAVEVENAYGVVVEAKRREEAWARDEHLTKQWIASTQDAIELGTKDERAITEPLRYFVNARISHTTALMDLNVALSELARVSGWDAAAPK
jgi:multidrug efflux system outer membrane protein